MPTPISVIIPVKNEIENLVACIASARLIATEVIVADSGSTDGTLEFAKQYADRVVEREYGNSGDFKNWAIPQANHEWVFIIDADERITPELAYEIQQTLAAPHDLQAYSVPRRNFFLGYPLDHGDWARDRVTRLILRDHCRYKLHTDHAEIEVAGGKEGRLEEKLVHYTAWDLDSYLIKMQHYAKQQADLWAQQGRRPRIRNLVCNAPLRFLRGYVLQAGFRDGMIGFHLACLTAYYSFLKQFLLWQKCCGKSLTDFEPDYAARPLNGIEDAGASDSKAA